MALYQMTLNDEFCMGYFKNIGIGQFLTLLLNQILQSQVTDRRALLMEIRNDRQYTDIWV